MTRLEGRITAHRGVGHERMAPLGTMASLVVMLTLGVALG